MAKQTFVMTGKDLIKLSVMAVTAVTLFGVPGLLMLLLMQWLTRQAYATEVIGKHGISSLSASRLGGVAVFVCTLVLIIVGYFKGLVRPNDGFFMEDRWIWWIGVIASGLLGLVEDLHNDYLSPRLRLYAEMIIFGSFVGFIPSLIPVDLWVPGLDVLMAVPILGWLFTTVFCVGFVNSINMADGANGLISGMMTIAFGIMFMETQAFVYVCLMSSCALFAIFNVISGRLFLGDAGAYGLGAAVVLSGLYLFSEGILSAMFMACLFAYPCIDFIATLARRVRAGRSITLPDNDHLHNRVHHYFQNWFSSPTLANSLTGLLLVGGSSGLALAGYFLGWWPITGESWVWLFLFQVIMYVGAFLLTGAYRPSPRLVADA